MTDAARTAVTPPSRFAQTWRHALESVPRRTPFDALGVTTGDTVCFIGAHPDDETFAAGGTLAQLAAEGVVVHILILTAGEAALQHLGRVIPGLADRRRDEHAKAAQALGAASSTVLDLPDAGLSQHEEAAGEAVRRFVVETRPNHVLSVWWDDPHSDHQVAGRAARRGAEHAGCQVSGCPIWAQHWSEPKPLLSKATSVNLMNIAAPAALARTDAMSCYTSQTEPLAGDLRAILPAAMTAWDLEIMVTE